MSDNINSIDNILGDVKSQIGVEPTDKAFDKTIIPAINTVFMFLKRMGVGPEEGFTITPDGDEQWSDFMEDGPYLEGVKTYVALKTGMMFDPPTSNALAEAKKEAIRELEFSLHLELDVMADSEEV